MMNLLRKAVNKMCVCVRKKREIERGGVSKWLALVHAAWCDLEATHCSAVVLRVLPSSYRAGKDKSAGYSR
jgi:hypothetical protein